MRVSYPSYWDPYPHMRVRYPSYQGLLPLISGVPIIKQLVTRCQSHTNSCQSQIRNVNQTQTHISHTQSHVSHKFEMLVPHKLTLVTHKLMLVTNSKCQSHTKVMLVPDPNDLVIFVTSFTLLITNQKISLMNIGKLPLK